MTHYTYTDCTPEEAAALIREQARRIEELARIIHQAEPWVMELRAHYDREMREAETMTKWIEWERRALEALKVKP